MKKRIYQIELLMKYPHDIQDKLFKTLIESGKRTSFGKEYGFADINNVEQYKKRVPIQPYESLFPYIDRLMKGEKYVLWPGEIKWYAKSSGTTNAQSKFIPVSQDTLDDCHLKGGKDLLSIYVNNYPDTKMFTGKGLAITGSRQINKHDPSASSYCGDVSTVILQNLSLWLQLIRAPSLDIALIDDWEKKIQKIAADTINENITILFGVPTWMILLIRHIVEVTEENNILKIWPNLEVFFHGAVAFEPYRNLFQKLIPIDTMNYVNTYNASEGFFGIQDQKDSDDLLLMLGYGIYYEFIPFDELKNDNPKTLELDKVEIGQNYAMIITTNSGLWRYDIGDTIKFTCLSPYRIKVSGRTKQFINAFGEELIIENAETAITKACEMTETTINNFTAAPVYFAEGGKGGHEWVIEFIKKPASMEYFTEVLDKTLRKINSDYNAKRHKDMALQIPIIHHVKEGTFYNWMKKRGKLGGQYKVPRLSNTREYIEDILKMLNSNTMV